MDRTLLTTAEMQAILAGLRSLDSVSGTRRYAQLMEKLSAGSGTLVPGGAHTLIDLAAWDRAALAPKFEAIQGAIEDHRTLTFAYFSPKGVSQREAEPCYLVFHWSAWYLWAWCRQRQDYRLFKLNRMTDLAVGEAFSPRQEPLPDLDAARVFPPACPVTVLIHPRYQWRLVEEFGADSFTLAPDGRLRFVGAFPDEDGLLSWLLTFGEGAELVEPAALRARLRQLGETLAQKYRDAKEA